MHGGTRWLPIQHLSVRLTWHDTGWTGGVGNAPPRNSSRTRAQGDALAAFLSGWLRRALANG